MNLTTDPLWPNLRSESSENPETNQLDPTIMPTNPPLSFQEFVQSLTGAEIHHFAATANFKAAGDTEFAEMKAHLVQRYQGINARHTFVDDHGQIFDCIPIEQQPGAKASGGQIATPPELPGAHPPAGTAHRPQLSADRQDPFGNAMSCPVGTVPTILRVLGSIIVTVWSSSVVT